MMWMGNAEAFTEEYEQFQADLEEISAEEIAEMEWEMGEALGLNDLPSDEDIEAMARAYGQE